jgi:phage shock protein PspC (stress-responsive transcriptional regulator)
MSIADDLTRLEQLHDRGSLSADEFQRAKNKLLSAPYPTEPILLALNGLRRSATDRWLGGVCAGLATATGVAAWLWRIAFTLMLCTGFGLLAYLVLWIFVPLEQSVSLARAS